MPLWPLAPGPWRALAALALLVLGTPLAAAQPERLSDTRIRFRHLDSREGGPTSTVTVLHQDRLGFMWIGTRNGLSRYDGDRLRLFKPVPFDSTSLRNSWISALADADRGDLWVATESGGLHRYDPRRAAFRHLPDLAPSRIRALAPTPDSGLWVGLAYDGLLDVDPETGRSVAHRATPATPDALPSDRVDALLRTRDGDLWVGTNDGGLARRASGSRVFRTYRPTPGDPSSLPNLRIRTLHEDSQGRVWIGTPSGLARYAPATDAFVPYRTGDPAQDDVNALLGDPTGAIWVGSAAGLDRLDPETGTRTRYRHDPADPTSLADGAITALALSRDGVLWAGGPSSVSYASLAPPLLGHITHDPDDPNSLGSGSVWMIYEDRAGTLWVGTNAGLDRVDRASGRVTRYASGGPSGLAPGNVGGIYEARDGTFWVTTRPGGLHRFDREAGRVVERFAPELGSPTGQHSENPWWMLEDRRGRTWITSGGPGCLQEFHRESGTFTAHCHDPDDPNTPAGDFARYLIEGRDGTLWLGTWGHGLDRIDPETGAFTHYRHDPTDPNTPSSDFIIFLTEAENGTLWLGTVGGGMSQFDPATETFTHYSGLPDDNAYAILPDRSGTVWVSTDAGLARFDPETGITRVFGLADGMQALEFNSGASFRSASGELFFGGVNGINFVTPEAVSDGLAETPVVVTRVRVGEELLVPAADGPLAVDAPYAEEIRLGPRQRDVGFSFSALSYTARPRYRVRLEGYDAEWHDPGTTLEATYTNLEPGRYTFRVQMASPDGTWNEEGAALAVVVAPKWFEAWWFRLLIGLALAGGVALAFSARERLRRENEAHLEAQVEERTVALRAEKRTTEAQAERLREMDRLKTRFFTNVSHEFRTPLTLTIGPLEDLDANAEALPAPARRSVDLALRNSRRLLRLINQLLDVARLEAGEMRLDAHHIDLGETVRAIALSFAPLAERRRVRYEIEVPETPVWTLADTEKLEHIFINLISNAFKFTPEGGTIRVEVLDETGAAVTRVRDSGPGIAEADLPHLFDRFYQTDGATPGGSGIGLSLAKDFADLHGGTLGVESVVGFGTLFTVRLPLGQEPPDGTPPPTYDPGTRSGDGEPLGLPGTETTEGPDDRTLLLIADDNADIRAYVRGHLQERYRILEAPNGAKALTLAREHLPDLIISDVMMPELDGVGLVRALRADRETDFLPVILLTAKAEEANKVEGLEAGADAYVVKPFNVRTLQAQIDSLIASRQRLRTSLATGLVSATVPGPADAPSSPLSSDDAAWVEQVRNVVEARLGDEDLTIEDIAVALDQSRSTLHRRLRAITGDSPSEFVRSLRLDHAAALLDRESGTVSEVAYAVGFKSVSHFSQVFRARFGTTPTAYTARLARGE